MNFSDPFGENYAQWYDTFYNQEKDYVIETEHLVQQFNRHHVPGKRVLDLACGTGGHALELARRGYRITGVDLAPAMLDLARAKAEAAGYDIDFIHCPMEQFQVKEPYDAAVCLFAAFDYLTGIKQVRSFIANLRRLVRPGGLFIMDFWNENQFKEHFETWRVKELQADGRKLIRISQSTHLPRRHALSMRIRCLVHEGAQVLADFSEIHTLRYWRKDDLRREFESQGIRVLQMFSFLADKTKGTSKSWIVYLTARMP